MADAATIEIDIDKVCFIVVKVREYEEESIVLAQFEDEKSPYEEEDGGYEEDDLSLQDDDDGFGDEDVEGEAETEGDPYYQEIFNFLNNLNTNEQIQVVALSWLGRGDYDVEDWELALDAAEERHNEHTPEYLLGMPRLADYLEEGLQAFGQSCADFDENTM